MTYIIEKDVPIELPMKKALKPSIWPFRTMEIGDSIRVNDQKEWKKVSRAAHAYAYGIKSSGKIKKSECPVFTCRWFYFENHGRIWRVQ